ncbi:hypothetical protein B0H10DRAFT_2231734 [Mycena sp. CBHHK59/15]|nr:hypothetical protein B0H10DRAFT_2231734 [Mycena sp. CBHHK59/15]
MSRHASSPGSPCLHSPPACPSPALVSPGKNGIPESANDSTSLGCLHPIPTADFLLHCLSPRALSGINPSYHFPCQISKLPFKLPKKESSL